ncbi:phospho-N-acetylmuramoyl-pentapeptide-transferase [Calderihabitans maritimus]|uniref:Phospho-N-acetylmuramoyl-pentapeptide-transferase n=1 Tax=Calderihabitans maritimus TaxID=1246530 RepID=A0A1Z5HS03_9FIRM|nr:phospho-N-acetylmuramoyl-pentapeptide-transferase [Calderihabitans maritimus]GAW92147.1 phospho-N-acetylmuramoyl-pentapeptide-transferase [Calderihabitans maritimus]
MKAIIVAFGLSGIITLILGPVIIPWLQRLRVGQSIRTDGPRTHLTKAGTPTMGGILFLAAIVITTVVLKGDDPAALLVLATTLGYAGIGFTDDFIKVVLRRPLGLKARHKLTAQVIMALALAIVSMAMGRGTEIVVPLLGFHWNLSWFYPIFATLVLVSTSNAVNLTDGLDGLAAGVTAFASLAYVLIALMVDKTGLAVFAAAVAGGCIGFLRFNAHPARVFMGDTGSLALGAALGSLAVLTGTELVLPVVGGVFVAESLSVIIQVISFRLTGKRVFRMSPLHHHFELSGWKEKEIVNGFWLAGVLLAVLGILFMYNLG